MANPMTELWLVRWYEGGILHVEHCPEGEKQAFNRCLKLIVDMTDIKAEFFCMNPLEGGTVDLETVR